MSWSQYSQCYDFFQNIGIDIIDQKTQVDIHVYIVTQLECNATFNINKNKQNNSDTSNGRLSLHWTILHSISKPSHINKLTFYGFHHNYKRKCYTETSVPYIF